MSNIEGKVKSIRELLKGVRYSIDYYQREYKWEQKHAQELINDLVDKFLECYDPSHNRKQIAKYTHYFLGSIIISLRDEEKYIIDGQQRLTSLTLLLMVLKHRQKNVKNSVNVDELIFSEQYGEKSFNISVNDRAECMQGLYDDGEYNAGDLTESENNMVSRYQDMESAFPEFTEEQLPYFIDWLLERVKLVEITAYSDEDAYTIFETMNDRGLSLNPTDMLKGYLLSNVDEDKRTNAGKLWKKHINALNKVEKEGASDFFKAWLRSQYAKEIRERKRGAEPKEFDKIGTEFHRWLRNQSKEIGLDSKDHFYNFIETDFSFFARQYEKIIKASQKRIEGLESIFYNAQHGFTLQNMLLLAPLLSTDNDDTVHQKLSITGNYIDIMLAQRLWGGRRNTYSTMKNSMFNIMNDIRKIDVDSLVNKLKQSLDDNNAGKEAFSTNSILAFNGQNRPTIHRILARMSDYVEASSGMKSNYEKYFTNDKNKHEVEHIWADKFDRHAVEFGNEHDFHQHRNLIGGLLLLPKSSNASYNDLSYEDKLKYYPRHNLLAYSLHSDCYARNPGFKKFVAESGLPFKPYAEFNKAAIEERCELYRKIAKLIWDPNRIAVS